MSDLLKETKLLIDGLHLNCSEENGQNFLVDEDVLKTEIEKAGLEPDDIVLDIGSGFGYTIREASKICRVIGVEKDVKIFSYLINKYELNGRVELINEDFLSLVPPVFTKVISNPPYNITDRILNKLIKYDFKSGVMILPKTISDDLCGIEKEKRTKFSVLLKSFFEFSSIMEIPKTAFYPQPRVTSRMVGIVKKPDSFLQRVLKKDEMTVKNSILRTYQSVLGKTKRESRNEINLDGLKDIAQKEVKKLTLNELDSLIMYIDKNSELFTPRT